MPSDTALTPEPRQARRHRPSLTRRALIWLILFSAAIVPIFYLLRQDLSVAWSTPGSPPLYLLGVAGTVLLLMPFAFSVAKRSGLSASPPTWFIAHVVGACLGTGLLVIHSAGHLTGPPALMLLGAVFLILQGAWARTHLPYRIAGTFAGKHRAFHVSNSVNKTRLAEIIDTKRALLAKLDPAGSEATFSPTLAHWLRAPLLSRRYIALAREEMKVIGQRDAVPPAQAHWRAVHMAVAVLMLLGIVIHVITITFFAGYVADGEPITWWHLADWGGSW